MAVAPFRNKRFERYRAELGPMTQAERVIARFGGAYQLAKALARAGTPWHPCSVYRWNYPKEKHGTGGIVPSNAWPAILNAARLAGIMITQEDTDPRILTPVRSHIHDDTFE